MSLNKRMFTINCADGVLIFTQINNEVLDKMFHFMDQTVNEIQLDFCSETIYAVQNHRFAPATSIELSIELLHAIDYFMCNVNVRELIWDICGMYYQKILNNDVHLAFIREYIHQDFIRRCPAMFTDDFDIYAKIIGYNSKMNISQVRFMLRHAVNRGNACEPFLYLDESHQDTLITIYLEGVRKNKIEEYTPTHPGIRELLDTRMLDVENPNNYMMLKLMSLLNKIFPAESRDVDFQLPHPDDEKWLHKIISNKWVMDCLQQDIRQFRHTMMRLTAYMLIKHDKLIIDPSKGASEWMIDIILRKLPHYRNNQYILKLLKQFKNYIFSMIPGILWVC